MSFISLEFIAACFIALIIYWILPAKIRWVVLLLGSVLFYLTSGWQKLLIVIATGVIVYTMALFMGKVYSGAEKVTPKEKSKARVFLVIGIIAVLAMLVYSKSIRYIISLLTALKAGEFSAEQMIIPLGISYYSFGAVGYLADVYWKKQEPEKNFFRLILCMIYFPQILQGPIPRYKKLAAEFSKESKFDYKAVCFGLQRALWGYFKKMVIADRCAMITGEVLSGEGSYTGIQVGMGIIFSAFQLYADFSGCMDIALGISEAFGVKLDENFKRPFFSKSASEFWRRWHITLGTWFKDYVYMPLVINNGLIKLSKKVKDKLGSRAAKNLMTIVPLACVWLLTGLWHGTGADYIIWGLYWGTIITLTTVFAPEIKKLMTALKINTSSDGWKVFQMVRTFLIFCGGRLLTASGGFDGFILTLKNLFVPVTLREIGDVYYFAPGIGAKDFWICIYGLIILFVVSIVQERGISVRESLSKLFLPIRWTIYVCGIIAVIVFGLYGAGYDASAFVYMKY